LTGFFATDINTFNEDSKGGNAVFYGKFAKGIQLKKGRLRRLSRYAGRDELVYGMPAGSTGGFGMWMKDGEGNWYMAGQPVIDKCKTPEGFWMKDTEGQWMLSGVQHKNETIEINALPEEGLTVNRAV